MLYLDIVRSLRVKAASIEGQQLYNEVLKNMRASDRADLTGISCKWEERLLDLSTRVIVMQQRGELTREDEQQLWVYSELAYTIAYYFDILE